MSLATPTVQDINDAIIAQLEATLNQTIPLLPKSFLRVLSKTFAAVFILLYKYGGFIFLQLFVKTATIEDVEVLGQTVSPLKEWGRLIGVGDPTPATQAELSVQIEVTVIGGSLPAGTQFVNADNGVVYLLVTSVVLTAAQVTGQIRASGDQGGGNGAGVIGNLVNGDIVSFVNPPSNVQRETTVTATVVTGANQEDTEIYRGRIFDRFQQRPQGGALIDYKFWGEEVAGIINIYPYTGVLPGHADVFAEATVESSGNPDGIPTAAQLGEVYDAIQLDENGLASRIPANAFVEDPVFPITRTGFDVEVIGLADVDNPSAIQDQITSAMTEFFLEREPFVSGVTLPPRTDTITQSSIIASVEAIVSAAGGRFDAVSFSQTGFGAVLNIYTLGQGEKSKLTLPVVFSP